MQSSRAALNPMPMTDIRGTVIAGHGVASGRASDSPYPAGTISLQRPFFQDLGLDLADCFEGTLNVSVAPMELMLRDPDHTFECVDWSDRHPPETFSFWRIELIVDNVATPAWVYRPHPETKHRHWQPPSMVEVLSPFRRGLTTGSVVSLHDPRQRFRLIDGIRLRARLLEFLKFRVLASQASFFEAEHHVSRRDWLQSLHPEALQLSDDDLDRVWEQARTLYTED